MILLLCIAAVIPSSARLSSTIWDEVIIEYASQIDNYSGIQRWFFDSGWFQQYYQIYFIGWIAKLFNISYVFINILITTIILYLMTIEVLWLARNKLQLDKFWQIFVALIFILAPTWSLLVSAVMTYHFICLYLGLIGVRLIQSKSGLRFVGIIILLLAFGYPGNLLFIPALSLFYDLVHQSSEGYDKIILSKSSYFIFFIAVIYFFASNQLFPSTGKYNDYNSLRNIFTPNGVKKFILGALKYASYLIPAFPAIIVYILNVKSLVKKSGKYDWLQIKKLCALLLLLIASIFSFLAVGKSTYLFDVKDWNNRKAFVYIIPIVMLYGTLLSIIDKGKLKHHYTIRIISKLTIIFDVILFGALTVSSHFNRINRRVFENELSTEISAMKEEIPEGRILLIGESPIPNMRIYESNYMFYKIYGNANRWSKVTKSDLPNFEIYSYLEQPGYQLQYIYNKNEKYDNKLTIIKYEIDGFDTMIDIIKNAIGLENEDRSVRLIEIKKVSE